MIYEQVPDDAPIRQGDIFFGLPRAELALRQLVLATDSALVESDWLSISDEAEVQALVTLRSVLAIVISQDCDATRAADISFCEIRPFHDVERDAAGQADSPKKWVRLVTQQARKNQKWFYMPPEPSIKISERSAVDFRLVFSVGLDDLTSLVSARRVGRLNDVATSHFRERIAEFFRRYPYDEWYPLDKSEYDYYKKDMDPPPEPFPWQQ